MSKQRRGRHLSYTVRFLFSSETIIKGTIEKDASIALPRWGKE